jgi:hypothetical protein
MNTRIDDPIPLLEDLLAPWRAALGADYMGYRNHVYRMAHCCFALQACNDEARRKILIAAAFHDLGIWSAGTVDYLPPSVALARQYLIDQGLSAWCEEVELMIDMHHKLRRHDDPRFPLVEVFRQGDLVDFSLGLVTFGLPAAHIRALKAAFPNAGFHRRLLQLAGGWFARHPLSPPPFIKW